MDTALKVVDSRRTYIWTVASWAILAGVFITHTVSAWRYFDPTWRDLAVIFSGPGSFFLHEWSGHLLRMLGALISFASCPGLGRILWPRREGALDVFIRLGLGLVVWSLLGLGLAASGLCRPVVLRTVSVLLVSVGVWIGARDLLFIVRGILSFRFRSLSWPGAWTVLLSVFYLSASLVPEVFYDALVYHLAVPEAYLRAGRWVDFPHIHLTRLPGFVQTLYLWGLAWSDDRFCKILTLGWGLLTAGVLAGVASRKSTPEAGRWAGVFFLSAPLVGIHLWSCGPDAAAALLALLGIALLDSSFDGSGWRRNVAAGLLLGAACAAKYTALAAAPYALWVLMRGPAPRLRGTALVALGVGIVLAPWWIRGALWTGNPFFPMLARWLGGDSPENIALLSSWTADARGALPFIQRILSFFRSSLFGTESGRFSFLGPIFLMMLPFALARREDVKKLALPVLLGYPLFALSSGHLRYFIPLLPFLCLWVAAAMDGQAGRNPGQRRWIHAAVSAAVAMNVAWLALAFSRFNQGWSVVWGRESPARYALNEHVGVYGHPSQGAFDFLRRAGARRLFLIGEARIYRSPCPTTASGNFNRPPLADWLSLSPEEAVRSLRQGEYSHLAINGPEFLRVTPAAFRTERHVDRLNEVLAILGEPIYMDSWCVVFEVAPKPDFIPS